MRLIAITFSVLAVTQGFHPAKADEAPKRSAELQVLERFVGTWKGVTKFKAGERSGTETGILTRKWSRGGKGDFLLEEGTAQPGNRDLHGVWTYDPDGATYRATFMGHNYALICDSTWDDETQTMTFRITDHAGNSGTSRHWFNDEDHAEWSAVIKNPDGEVVYEGSSKQTRIARTALDIKQVWDGMADEIVAQHLKAVGGDKAHKKLTTRKVTGTLAITGIGGPWKMTGTQKAPNLKHVSIEIPDVGVVTEGFDGKIAWKREPGNEARKLAGEEFKLKQRDSFFYRFIDLKSQYKTLTYAGRETVKGKEYDVLKGIYEDGAEEAIYFDVKAHLIRLVRIWVGTETLNVELNDYREVDGVQLAFSADLSFGTGEAFLTIKVDKITHGVKVDDALFASPAD